MHQHPSRCLILQAQTKSEKGVLPPATNIICISISCVESHRSVQKPNYAELVCLQNCKISFYNPLSSRGRQLPRVWAKMGSLHRWPDWLTDSAARNTLAFPSWVSAAEVQKWATLLGHGDGPPFKPTPSTTVEEALWCNKKTPKFIEIPLSFQKPGCVFCDVLIAQRPCRWWIWHCLDWWWLHPIFKLVCVNWCHLLLQSSPSEWTNRSNSFFLLYNVVGFCALCLQGYWNAVCTLWTLSQISFGACYERSDWKQLPRRSRKQSCGEKPNWRSWPFPLMNYTVSYLNALWCCCSGIVQGCMWRVKQIEFKHIFVSPWKVTSEVCVLFLENEHDV